MTYDAIFDEAFRSQPQEHSLEITSVEGTVPGDVDGTFLANIPALLKVGNDELHFFDGHGMIAGVKLSGGKARFQSRFVKTPVYLEEVAAGRQTRRRVFTNHPSRLKNVFNLKFANPASHDVYVWRGKIHATGDSAHFQLDPRSYDTVGQERWGLPEKHQMCLMPRRDEHARRLVCFSIKPGPPVDEVTFFELDEQGAAHHHVSTRMRAAPAFIHDHAFSEHHYVVVENPVKMNLGAALLGTRPTYLGFAWQEGQAPALHILPRGKGAPAPRRVDLPAHVRTVFHIINAYEADGKLVVELPAVLAPVRFHALYPRKHRESMGLQPEGELKNVVLRCIVDVESGALQTEELGSMLGDQPEVNGAWHGKKARHAYLRTPASDGSEPDPSALLWWHGLTHLDLDSGAHQTWSAGAMRFCGPPSFAPRQGATEEDDGYLLAHVLDARRKTTDVVILDARDVKKGPVATLHLGQQLPGPSHNAFYPGL
ncbi:MAG: carotenoid oxygenase family protein [Myxococcota bacterium]